MPVRFVLVLHSTPGPTGTGVMELRAGREQIFPPLLSLEKTGHGHVGHCGLRTVKWLGSGQCPSWDGS